MSVGKIADRHASAQSLLRLGRQLADSDCGAGFVNGNTISATAPMRRNDHDIL
jgi:hypothetical protein